MLQAKGYLPLPHESRRKADVILRRCRAVVIGLTPIVFALWIGTLLGHDRTDLADLARTCVLVDLALLIGIGAWSFVRKLYYYVPDRPAYRFFVIDAKGHVTPAVTGARYLRRQVLAITHEMDLSTTVRRRLPVAEPLRLYLFATFAEGALTAELASKLNWFYGRILEQRDDMSEVHAAITQIRRDHPDLPFRFTASFEGFPQMQL